MKRYEVEDIKTFMNGLLVDGKYDSFYMYEARIRTRLDYYINGKVNSGFFEQDGNDTIVESEEQELGEYTYWKEVKPLVFELMKGRHLPISFKLILMFNRDNIKRLIDINNIPIEATSVGALFYNIIYENGRLSVTTGTSIKVFTLDKSLEHVWDETVEKYYI